MLLFRVSSQNVIRKQFDKHSFVVNTCSCMRYDAGSQRLHVVMLTSHFITSCVLLQNGRQLPMKQTKYKRADLK